MLKVWKYVKKNYNFVYLFREPSIQLNQFCVFNLWRYIFVIGLMKELIKFDSEFSFGFEC